MAETKEPSPDPFDDPEFYDRDFTFDDWDKCWSKNKADWNKDFVDPILKKWLPVVIQKVGSGGNVAKVLLPLCGKSQDLIWCSEQGHAAAGVEYVDQAVEEFFADNKFDRETTHHGELQQHKCLKEGLKLSLWHGDFFLCKSGVLGEYDVAWDHGGFTAVNSGDRERYVDTLVGLLRQGGAVVMSSFVFGEEGPLDMNAYFGEKCSVEVLEELDTMYGPDHQLGPDHSCHGVSCKRFIHLLKKK